MGNCKSAETRRPHKQEQKVAAVAASNDKATVHTSVDSAPPCEKRSEDVMATEQNIFVAYGDDDEDQFITRRNPDGGLLDSPQESNMYDYPESPAMGLRSNTAFLPTPMLPAQGNQWTSYRSNVTSETPLVPLHAVPTGQQQPLPSSSASPASSSCSPVLPLPPSQRQEEEDTSGQHNKNTAKDDDETPTSCNSSSSEGANDIEVVQEAAMRRKASVATVREWFLSSMTMSQEELCLIPAT